MPFYFETDPQGGKTTTNAAPAGAAATKRSIDKLHAASPIKRAKTTPVGKKQH